MNPITDGIERTLNCTVTIQSLDTIVSAEESGLNAFGSYPAISYQDMLMLNSADYTARLNAFILFLENKYGGEISQLNSPRRDTDKCSIANTVSYAQLWGSYVCEQNQTN